MGFVPSVSSTHSKSPILCHVHVTRNCNYEVVEIIIEGVPGKKP